MGASKTVPESFLVRTVYKDSPAAEAGIATGDTIVAVDGVAATELSGTDLFAKSRQVVGTPLQLGIVHDGGRRDVTLILREVLP
jgi:C-terminal processing protease CtpA/Prc